MAPVTESTPCPLTCQSAQEADARCPVPAAASAPEDRGWTLSPVKVPSWPARTFLYH